MKMVRKRVRVCGQLNLVEDHNSHCLALSMHWCADGRVRFVPAAMDREGVKFQSPVSAVQSSTLPAITVVYQALPKSTS